MILCLTSTETAAAPEDAVRLERCLAGIARQEPEALEALYHQAAPAIFSYALSLLKNAHDAEDVLHDCCVAVYSAAEQYRPQGKPMAWILTIAKNLCLRKLRVRQRTAQIPPEDWEPYLQSHPGLDAEDRAAIRYAMEALSDTQRQIVTLHAVAGFKHREIARFLDLPLSTVLSAYNRAIKKLRKLYEGEES